MKPVYLYITPYFSAPDRHFGSYSLDFVLELKRQSNYEVIVFVPNQHHDYEIQGVKVHTFPTRCLPGGAFPLMFASYNRNSFLAKLHTIGLAIRDIKICHCNTATFGIYALAIKAINPRCLTLLHHHDLASWGLRTGRLRHLWLHKIVNYFLLRRIHESVDCHVFISEASRYSFLKFPDTSWSCYKDYYKLSRGIKYLRPVKIKNSYVLWNGVDKKLFNTEIKSGGRPNGFIIGTVGNFIEVKDHLLIVQVVNVLRNRIPGLRLRVLGTSGVGNYFKEFKDYIARHHLENIVDILPNCSHDKLADFYRSIDLFVLPSYFEGFGCVYTESNACGTPFIACEGQGIEEVVPGWDRDKWLVPPRDKNSLCAAIMRQYDNPASQKLLDGVYINEVMQRHLAALHQLETVLCC